MNIVSLYCDNLDIYHSIQFLSSMTHITLRNFLYNLSTVLIYNVNKYYQKVIKLNQFANMKGHNDQLMYYTCEFSFRTAMSLANWPPRLAGEGWNIFRGLWYRHRQVVATLRYPRHYRCLPRRCLLITHTTTLLFGCQ